MTEIMSWNAAGPASRAEGGPVPASAPVAEFASAGAISLGAWLASLLVLGLGYAREIAAAAAGVDSRLYGFADLRLDGENCLPSWYSASLMLLSALLMLLVARCDRSSTGRSTRWHWGILGVVFTLLSADESISLHEQLMQPMHALFSVSGYFYFGWVVAGLGFVVVMALGYLPFLLRVARRTAIGLVLAAAVYLAGALGLEMFGGYVYERFGPTPYYVFVSVCEETLEIVGLTMLFSVMLAHAASVLPPIRLVAPKQSSVAVTREEIFGQTPGRAPVVGGETEMGYNCSGEQS